MPKPKDRGAHVSTIGESVFGAPLLVDGGGATLVAGMVSKAKLVAWRLWSRESSYPIHPTTTVEFEPVFVEKSKEPLPLNGAAGTAREELGGMKSPKEDSANAVEHADDVTALSASKSAEGFISCAMVPTWSARARPLFVTRINITDLGEVCPEELLWATKLTSLAKIHDLLSRKSFCWEIREVATALATLTRMATVGASPPRASVEGQLPHRSGPRRSAIRLLNRFVSILV